LAPSRLSVGLWPITSHNGAGGHSPMRWAACQRRGQLRGPQPDLLPDSSRPTLRTGIIAWPSPFGSVAARIGAGSRRRRPSDAPAPICAPVPRGAWAAQGECAFPRAASGAPTVAPRPMPAARGCDLPGGRGGGKLNPQCRADGRTWVRREVCDQGFASAACVIFCTSAVMVAAERQQTERFFGW
jgi:hypothetical protein